MVSQYLQRWFGSYQSIYVCIEHLQEKPVEHHVVEYIPCEAEYNKGEVTYYVVKEDGEKTSYTPAYGDAPVEYVIKGDDGSTEPYTGPIQVVTKEFTPGGS